MSSRAILRVVRKPRTCDSCNRRASTRRAPKTHEARFVGDMCICKHCWRAMNAVTRKLQGDTPPSIFLDMPTIFADSVKRLFEQDCTLLQQFHRRSLLVGERGDFTMPINLPSRHTATVTVTKQE